jgi:hypothetical protein
MSFPGLRAECITIKGYAKCLHAPVHSRAKRNTTMKANIDVLAKLGEEGFDG